MQVVSGMFDALHKQNEALTTLVQRSVRQRTTTQELEAETLCELIQQQVHAQKLSEQLNKPVSFSQNRFVMEAYRTMNWL